MDEATLNQVRAAEPDSSTWLSANAGSGKTKVLIDRVARLLLHGTPPQRILCLTYTKAAASEMQNRLFQRLGDWAMRPDESLRAALAAMGEDAARPDMLPRARRLFARAIETPGGLKIQTIHAFCASILRRFPLEAGVPPDFAEADERSLEQLRREVLDRFARGPDAETMTPLLLRLDEGRFAKFLGDIGRHRPAFDGAMPDLDAAFGLPAGLTLAHLQAKALTGDEAALIDRLLPHLRAGGPNDNKLADKLARWCRERDLSALEDALLVKSGDNQGVAKTGKHITKHTRKGIDAADLAALDDLGQRIEDARPRRLALAQRDMALALHRFARLWLPAVDAAKARRGWLDFDDLIRLARRLLRNSDVAQWVLFKLDGGIDHILIDEAQDTSPEQWQVIDLLTQEFTAGQGARDAGRTVFVVGDRKQSIYSFQGADLHGFEAARGRFGDRLAATGQGLVQAELLHSFRSSDAILRLVDACFAPDLGAGGLGGAPLHIAFHPARAGRVDLWPPVEKAPSPPETHWTDPLDRAHAGDPEVVLARAIAAEIRALIDRGEQIEGADGPRPLHEGDVLILVRRRSTLFEALIRACKGQGLAIAGADRLVLGDELAVRDLIALLNFLALPEDDLSLAVALRSPLFGLSEDALYRLAQGRPGFLWERLRDDPAHADVRAVLDDLRAQVDFLRPFEVIERILTRHDGRRRIRARLGDEVIEAIEAFVDLALAYEAEQVPTLDGFLGWIAASEAEIKRQPESAGRRLRVMTVHGAKGLEAPLVILPDTAARRAPHADPIVAGPGGTVFLSSVAAEASILQAEASAAMDQLRREESDRLLYVALTRAERWLIVCGAGDTDDPSSWYARVHSGLSALAPLPLNTPTGAGMRHAHGVWPSRTQPVARQTAEAARPVLLSPLPLAPARGVLSPSALGGAKALPGEGAETTAALARGRLIHRLLEDLPRAESATRDALAVRLIADQPEGAACLAEVQRLLADPSLTGLFGRDALVEVALAGDWLGRPMGGVIDRLLITPDRVLAIDFKSNRVVPAAPSQVPEGLLRQMGAYAHLLAPLFVRRRIETALLWTATATLMPLPSGLVDAALARAALDPAVVGS